MGVTQLQNDHGGGAPVSPHDSQTFETYRLFDAGICSQISLPQLPVWCEAEPRIKVKTVKNGQIDLEGFVTCYDWKQQNGALICRSARRGSEYLFSFPGRVSFHILPGGDIRCLPVTGVSEELICQLLVNQVVPRFLAHTGALLLHASAVTLPNGKTLAFLGETGHGKSTLASYCQQQGAQIIDDDCILIGFEDRGLSIMGGVPTIRLYPDSLHALDCDPAGFVPCMEDSDKKQMRLPEGVTAGPESRVLDALFLLAAPGEVSGGEVVRIEPAPGQRAMMSVMNSVFSLDPSDPNTMSRTFSHAGKILNDEQGLNAKLLHYPRDFGSLESVFEALLDLL